MLNSPQTTESKLRSISGLSAFEFKDETIIRANFSEGIIRYSQSFLYLLRISHKDNGDPGYKYVDENVVAVLGYRNNILYIICVKDKTNGAAFESLCEEIVEVTNTPLIIKKMPSHVEFTMSPSKLNLAKSYLEDDTFPETLIRLKKLFTIDGLVNAKAARFIKKIKRFEKLKINYKIHYNLLDFDKEKVMNFFSMDNSKYVNYLPIISYLYEHGPDERYKVMIFVSNEGIEGIYIAEVFSNKDLGLYCAVTARNKPGITEWMDWYFFHQMFLLGVETIYFGGSESKGVDYYIKKLLPDTPTYQIQTYEFICKK